MVDSIRLQPPGEQRRLLRYLMGSSHPPLPRSVAASPPSPLIFNRSSTTTSGSNWLSPLLPAAQPPKHHDPSQWRWLSDKRPKAKVSVKPDHRVFRGETVTLRCDIDGEGVTSWRYVWYKYSAFYSSSELQEHTFSSVTESDAGKYSCYGAERGGSRTSDINDEVTLTVSDRAQAGLSVSPQKWLTEGDSVTLICEVYGSSTGWTFSWFTVTALSDNKYHYQLLSGSSRGAGGNYIVSYAALKHTGVYVCRAERGKPAYNTTYSNTQPVWVTGVSPPVSLVISPSRTQHFTSVSLSLSCEDQSNSDRWRVRRYTDSRQWEDCSSSVWGSETGSSCTINSTITSDTGVYWCQSQSGEKYHPVNITVHYGVILESPVHPVTEGDTMTLRCLYQHSTPSNLRADFYKDGSLIQSQTTEMIIYNVSKSHEGFYYCKHSERGESPKSWISLKAASRSDYLNPVIIGVSAGLTVTFLIIVLLVLLWCYRNKKGVRSQSPSSVGQQQNSSQTSEQNQSDPGNNTLLSGTAHIYDSVDATIKKDISTDSKIGPNDLTYAEIEHKSTKKQMEKKENKGKNTESCDIVYSKLKLEMDQGAGSGDVTYAQVK
ncbi:Fc receptor-like protein 5 [Carassius auratus]|uniref:Fc receptor-like protein 5 n=1 Tax=Carassius auratus TaxID=7957 RepID=A0A6P6KU08_CARAU|nr:Fc receptor-like protein 5 [Carassius auratus]